MSIKEVILKFTLATIIGGIVGYERENKNRPAGFRTHILVCIGTTMVSLIQLLMAENAIKLVKATPEFADIIKVDYARLGAQAIAGIGFLGAGTIIHTKGAIRGLTTAASLWVVAILGLAIGMGYYAISIIGGAFIVITLVVLKKFQKKFITRAGECVFEIEYKQEKETLEYINRFFNTKDIKTVSIELKDIRTQESNIGYEMLRYKVLIPKYIQVNDVINNLMINENIKNVKNVG